MRLPPRVTVITLAVLPLLALGPAVSAADLPVMNDWITAGVVRGSEGLGTSTVMVPSGGYVTYLVQGEVTMSERPLEIWTRTRATDWARVTTRTFGPDGAVRYHARISEWTAFQGRIPGDVTTAGTATHGRIATVATDGSTRIRLWCDDFTAQADQSSVLVSRAVGARIGSLVRVTVCSNASTGFSWSAAAVSSPQLALVGSTYRAGPSAIGSAGAETWTFRVTGLGTGYAVLEYSRPWEGGEKAIWLLVLRVN